MAAVGRDEAERLRHVVVRDVDDALGDPLAAEAEPLGERIEGARCRVEVELEVAGEQELRCEAAEHGVRVGHGGLRAAAPVAGRAGVGAGALWPDLEDAGRVDPGEAAPAGADRACVDHGQGDRDAVLELLEVRERRLGAGEQARLEARPAHVAGDQVAEAEPLAEVARRHDPAGGAGADEGDGLLARLLRGHDAAVRAEDEELPDPARLALVLKLLHVVVHERLEVGVEHGRRGTLVLAPAGQHLVRERDLDAGPELLEQLAGAELVLRVDEGEEVGDGDRGNSIRVAEADDLLA